MGFCRFWSGGFCRVLCRQHKELIPCPKARALEAGETCCHHPTERKRVLIEEMSAGGLSIQKIGDRLDSLKFVEQLYQAWKKRGGSRAARRQPGR